MKTTCVINKVEEDSGRPGRGCLASTREASSRQRCDSKRQTFVVAKASRRGGS